MTEYNQYENFINKIRSIADRIIKSRYLDPHVLEELTILLLLKLLSHYSGACRVVRAMNDDHIARLIVAIVDEKTTIGVPPCSTSFCDVVKISNGISADNRETISLEDYVNPEKPMPIKKRVQKVSRCQISFAFADELKRILIAKKHNNFSKKNNLDHVKKDELIEQLCKGPRSTQRLLVDLKMECILDNDPAGSKSNPFD